MGKEYAQGCTTFPGHALTQIKAGPHAVVTNQSTMQPYCRPADRSVSVVAKEGTARHVGLL